MRNVFRMLVRRRAWAALILSTTILVSLVIAFSYQKSVTPSTTISTSTATGSTASPSSISNTSYVSPTSISSHVSSTSVSSHISSTSVSSYVSSTSVSSQVSSTSVSSYVSSISVSSYVSSTSATSSLRTFATYVTSSPPNSSQWLVLRSSTKPLSVYANDSGTIVEYSSFSSLNQTKIGVYCVSVNPSTGPAKLFKRTFRLVGLGCSEPSLVHSLCRQSRRENRDLVQSN